MGWCWTVSASRCPAPFFLLCHRFLNRNRGPTEGKNCPETPAGVCRFLRMEHENRKWMSHRSSPPNNSFVQHQLVVCDAHSPCRGRGQPGRTALLTRMLRAAFTTACCPALRPQLLGDGRSEEEDVEKEEAYLAVTREIMASSTRGTTTAFQRRASHLCEHNTDMVRL